MTGRRPLDDLKGLEALAEIGRRLQGLSSAVETAATDVVKMAAEAALKARMAGQPGGTGHTGPGAGTGRSACGDHETTRAFEIGTPRGPLKGVVHTGFRVRTLADGPAPARSRPGQSMAARAAVKKAAQPAFEPAREPAVEVFDEGDAVLVTAELPGVAPGEIAVAIDGATLSIATTGARRFGWSGTLEPPHDFDAPVFALKNGILAVSVRRRAGASD